MCVCVCVCVCVGLCACMCVSLCEVKQAPTLNVSNKIRDDNSFPSENESLSSALSLSKVMHIVDSSVDNERCGLHSWQRFWLKSVG